MLAPQHAHGYTHGIWLARMHSDRTPQGAARQYQRAGCVIKIRACQAVICHARASWPVTGSAPVEAAQALLCRDLPCAVQWAPVQHRIAWAALHLAPACLYLVVCLYGVTAHREAYAIQPCPAALVELSGMVGKSSAAANFFEKGHSTGGLLQTRSQEVLFHGMFIAPAAPPHEQAGRPRACRALRSYGLTLDCLHANMPGPALV